MLQDVPWRNLKVFGQLSTTSIPLSLGRNFPNNLPLRPSPFFPLGSNRLSAVPGHLETLADADKSCLHGAVLYLSHLDHSATRKSPRPSELKVSKILRFLSSLASVMIRLKSTSTSSGPNRSSNSSTSQFHTETSFQILFRSCNDRSFPRTPTTSFSFVTSLLSFKGGVRILQRCGRCHSSSRYRGRFPS